MLEKENAAASPDPSPTASTIASASNPLEAIVEQQLADKPLPHPDLAGLAREAVSPADAETFDPAVHESDPITNGPIFNKDGSLRRKRGRVAGKAYDELGNPTAVGEGGCSPIQAKREARLCALTTFKALQSLGENWKPTPEEEKAVIEPLAEWLNEIGGIGMPTWAEVAVAFGAYVLCRINLARFLPPQLQGMVSGDAQQQEAAMQAMNAMQQQRAAAQQQGGQQQTIQSAPAPPGPAPAFNGNGQHVRRVESRGPVSGGEGFAFANAGSAR